MDASGRQVEQVEKYGIVVWKDVEGEAIRDKICLCLHCARLVTQSDVEPLLAPMPPDPANLSVANQILAERQMRIEELKAAYNCPVAQQNYANCVTGGVAAPITRCPMFIDKSWIKPQGE